VRVKSLKKTQKIIFIDFFIKSTMTAKKVLSPLLFISLLYNLPRFFEWKTTRVAVMHKCISPVQMEGHELPHAFLLNDTVINFEKMTSYLISAIDSVIHKLIWH
jgi:hypothetical protein